MNKKVMHPQDDGIEELIAWSEKEIVEGRDYVAEASKWLARHRTGRTAVIVAGLLATIGQGSPKKE